ncbi:MAG: hypothetical protein P4L46_04325 [Fimbriimonas sp.]|nr:hypothetical protein [Fimbriimonas sp.]
MLLFIGSLGFVSMTVLGFLHGGGGARAGSHPLSGHSHALSGHVHATGGSAHGALAHGAQAHTAGHAGKGGAPGQQPAISSTKGSLLLSVLAVSPLDVFSFAVGAGAVGLAFRHMLGGTPQAIAAVVGALVFDYGIVKPMMANLLRFSSSPSAGLEGQVAHVATAVTHFDTSGRGLVRIQMDGQISQLLATIDNAELHRGVQVNKGDEVVVIEVDALKNTCRVTRELAE